MSIGNDIIALKLINQSRTIQQKFYSKIIAHSEFELYQSNLSPSLLFEHFVWLAWSAKESVYKFYKRNNSETSFSPIKIVINKIDIPIQILQSFQQQTEAISFCKEECYCCEINFNTYTFFTRTLLQDDLIFTVANNANDFENIYWGIKIIDDDIYTNQSESVRKFILKRLNSVLLNDKLSVEKSDIGYPFLKQQKHLPISFTHHGNLVGYCFYLNKNSE